MGSLFSVPTCLGHSIHRQLFCVRNSAMKLLRVGVLFLSAVHALLQHARSYSSPDESSNVIVDRKVPAEIAFLPTAFALGGAPAEKGLQTYKNQNLKLSTVSPVLTLDYGVDVAGIPFFEVKSGSGQIEVKYTEDFDALDTLYGDGSWTFVNGLMNTFRTETFNVTGPGRFQANLLQGGQRWQTVTLLTNESISFSEVGFVPTVKILPTDGLPGSFTSSKSSYAEIWGLGARVVQAACFDEGSQPATWNITEDGALIPGQQPANSPLGYSLEDYTLSFMTKIVRGGTGWRVLSADLRSGPYFVITSNYPSHSTFVNTNRTLLPANTLVAGNGPSLISQDILPASSDQYYPLPMSIWENEWYNITTVNNGTGSSILINGTLGAFVSGGGSGSWGFGPFIDQIAYVKDVQVTAENGTLIYNNDFHSEDTLTEYGVRSNTYSVCVDGAKRDRTVWTGDFAHTTRTIAATTYRMDYITGLIENMFAFQQTRGNNSGLVATQAPLGGSAKYKDQLFPGVYGITDYQLFFLVTLGDYYSLSNDLAFLGKYWSQTKALVARMQTYIDPYSGLLGSSYDNYYFTAQGTVNATAPTALMVLALRNLIPIAVALDDNNTAASYTTSANNLSNAINTLMWNPTMGTYGISVSEPDSFSLTAIAFTIRAGIANASQAASSIAALPSLFLGSGYKDTSSAANSSTTQLSPNTQGFLLEALFIANKTLAVQSLDIATTLLDTFWPQMLSRSRYYTGATWEYLIPDGSPGIDLFTSLAHPWGSAPTYLLTQYVLGVSAVKSGYQKWSFAPLLQGLGLHWVNGSVPTPQGDIFAGWQITGKDATLAVKAPSGTTGVIEGPWLVGSWEVNGVAKMLEGSYEVSGGKEVIIVGSV
jgi:hypothetical protein